MTFRKSSTKGKLKTRVVDIQPGLAALLAEYQLKPGALFPGMGAIANVDEVYDRQDSAGCLQASGAKRCQHSQFQKDCPNNDVQRWYSLAGDSGNIGTQRFRDITALPESNSSAKTICCCCNWILI